MPTSTYDTVRNPRTGRLERTGTKTTASRERTSSGGRQLVETKTPTKNTDTISGRQEQEAIDRINQQRIDAGKPQLVGTNPPPQPVVTKPAPTFGPVQTMSTPVTPLAPGVQGPQTQAQYAARQAETITSPILNRPVTREELEANQASAARIQAAKQQAIQEDNTARFGGAKTAAQRSVERVGGTLAQATERGERMAQQQADFIYKSQPLSFIDRSGTSYPARAIKGVAKVPQRTATAAGVLVESGQFLIEAKLSDRKVVLEPQYKEAAKGVITSFDPREPENLVNIGLLASAVKGARVSRKVEFGETTTKPNVAQTTTKVLGKPELTSKTVYGSFESVQPFKVTSRTVGDFLLRKPGTTVAGETTTRGIISGTTNKAGTTTFEIAGKTSTTTSTGTTVTRPVSAEGITFPRRGTTVTGLRSGDTVSATRSRPAGSFETQRVVGMDRDILVTAPVTQTVSELSVQRGTIKTSSSKLFTPQLERSVGLETSTSNTVFSRKGYSTPQEYAFTATNLEGKQVFVRGITEKSNVLKTRTTATEATSTLKAVRSGDVTPFYREAYNRLVKKPLKANTISPELPPIKKSSTSIYESPLMKPEARLKQVNSKVLPKETTTGDTTLNFKPQKTVTKTKQFNVNIDTQVFKPSIRTTTTRVPTSLGLLGASQASGVVARSTPINNAASVGKTSTSGLFGITSPRLQQKSGSLLLPGTSASRTPSQTPSQYIAQIPAQVPAQILRQAYYSVTPQKVAQTPANITPGVGGVRSTPFVGGFTFGVPGGGIGGRGSGKTRSGSDKFSYAPTFTAAFFGIKASKKQRAAILEASKRGATYTGSEVIRPLL